MNGYKPVNRAVAEEEVDGDIMVSYSGRNDFDFVFCIRFFKRDLTLIRDRLTQAVSKLKRTKPGRKPK